MLPLLVIPFSAGNDPCPAGSNEACSLNCSLELCRFNCYSWNCSWNCCGRSAGNNDEAAGTVPGNNDVGSNASNDPGNYALGIVGREAAFAAWPDYAGGSSWNALGTAVTRNFAYGNYLGNDYPSTDPGLDGRSAAPTATGGGDPFAYGNNAPTGAARNYRISESAGETDVGSTG